MIVVELGFLMFFFLDYVVLNKRMIIMVNKKNEYIYICL